jgi:hypothetical protein
MDYRKSRTARDLLTQIIDLLGPQIRLLHAHEREWASITFTGSRHRLVFEVPVDADESPTLQLALQALPDHEFSLRGEIVADCSATISTPVPDNAGAGRRLLVIELLTVSAD